VKSLLGPKIAPPPPVERPIGASSLTSLFAPPANAVPPSAIAAADQRIADSIWPRALAEAFTPKAPAAPAPQTTFPQAPSFQPQSPASFLEPAQQAPSFTPQPQSPSFNPQQPQAPQLVPRPATSDVNKLRAEISRLELLIKKLQTELQIERQYNQALEQHLHNLTTE
jgi:hypothetical protein